MTPMASTMMFRARFDNGHQHAFEAAGWEAFLAEARRLEAGTGNPGGLVVSLWYQFRGEWASMDYKLDPPPPVLTLPGVDDQGRPRQAFADWIGGLDNAGFVAETTSIILAAADADARSEPDAEVFWQASACWAEAHRRRDPDLYQRAYDQARRSAGL